MGVRSRHRLLVLVVGALLLVLAPPAAALGHNAPGSAPAQSDVLVVDADGGADYETIQAALDAASAGDTIRVRAGEYDGFRVDKDVRLTGAGALVEGSVTIEGDAAPVIEGFTIQVDDTSAVSASNTDGDWELRDSSLLGGYILVDNSTGSWTIDDTYVEDFLQARGSTGDWRITNTALGESITTSDTDGDWLIRSTIVGSQNNTDTPMFAYDTTGDWRVENSAFLTSPDRNSIELVGSEGAWTIQGSYLSSALWAGLTSGDWSVRDSYIGAIAPFEEPGTSVDVAGASGAWVIVDSTIEGAVGGTVDFGGVDEEEEIPTPGRVTNIYWGQPGGPRTTERGLFQCLDPVNCEQARDSPPPEVPSRSIVADIGPDRSLVVDADGGGQFEEIQPAIDAANTGSTIRVRAGEYDGFQVNKSVQIITEGAAIDGNVRIAGDAAPVIEGFTIRNGRVNARETSGDWILRDVTANATAPGEVGSSSATKIDALDSTGNWRVVDSEVTQIQAQRTEGDWTVANTTVAVDLKAVASTGAWVVRASVIGTAGDDDILRLPAWESSGDWFVQDSAIIGTNATSIAADRSRGDWRIRGSYLSGELFATETTGSWTVRNSYLRGSTGTGSGRTSLVAGRSSGTWLLTESTVPGDVVASVTDQTADATGNYWGQPGGPRDEQCRGNVDCGQPLDRPPATIPPFLGRLDSPTANRAPTALVSVDTGLANGRTAVTPGTELTFDGTGSVDPDGEIQSYEWTVDGQSAGTGPQFTRTFDVPGTYLVTLTVDDGQTTGSREIAVVVTQSVGNESDGEVPDNLPPVAALDAPETTVPTGEAITLSAADSRDLDGDAFAEFRWDFDDDGRVERTTPGPTTTVSYDDPGEQSVSVVAVDSVGGTGSASTTIDVARAGAIPTARLAAKPNEDSEYVAGPPITFDAKGSTAPEGRIVAYEYDFGDGTTRRVDAETRRRIDPREGAPAVPTTTTHSYEVPGQYTVTLTVVDSAGRRASTSTQVAVSGSDRVQIGGVSSSIPGPMIDGVDIENEYAVRVTAPDDVESVVFEFPDGETREAVRGRQFSGPKSWFVPNVGVDSVTDPGTNVVEVRATDAEGRTGVETFAIDVFDPPAWFEFAMGPDPTLTRNDEGNYVLQSDEPTIPPGELIGPTFEFDVPVEEISGSYTVGVGANYGFEYVFADRLGTARGGGAISLTAPLDGLNLESDIGTDFGGSRSRSFSVDLSGTVRVTEDGRRAQFERGRVAFGTEVSATTPIAGVAVYIPALDTTVGLASVDLTLTEGFEPAVELEVNDARTALAPSEIELTNSLDLEVTAGLGSSVDLGVGRAGAEARGIVGTGAEFTTDVYPQLGVEQITVNLRAGVRVCLGPCGMEWLLNDDYPLLPQEDDRTAQVAVRP